MSGAEPQGHHGDPWNQRIGDDDQRVERERALLVEQPPQPRPRPERRRAHTIGEVVQRDERHAHAEQDPPRQMDGGGEHDHAPAQRPEHQQEQRVDAEVEEEREADGRHLEHDQPQPARQQKPRHRRAIAGAAVAEPDAQTGAEHEHRRAEVGDPARQEDRRRRPRQVLGLKLHRLEVDEVAGVVDGHQHHHQTAQDVDGGDARAARSVRHRAGRDGSADATAARSLHP